MCETAHLWTCIRVPKQQTSLLIVQPARQIYAWYGTFTWFMHIYIHYMIVPSWWGQLSTTKPSHLPCLLLHVLWHFIHVEIAILLDVFIEYILVFLCNTSVFKSLLLQTLAISGNLLQDGFDLPVYMYNGAFLSMLLYSSVANSRLRKHGKCNRVFPLGPYMGPWKVVACCRWS